MSCQWRERVNTELFCFRGSNGCLARSSSTTTRAGRYAVLGTGEAQERRRPTYPKPLETFNNRGDALTDADAHGGEAEASTTAFEFVEQGDDDAGATTAKGVAESD